MADPFVGPADLLPRLLRHAGRRLLRAQLDARASASASGACCRCTPTTARKSTDLRGRHLRRRRPEEHLHRRHALRPGQPDRCWRTIVFPEPVIPVAIEPKTKADQDKMGIALGRLAEEDPTFRVHTDEETGQTIIEGMGELHLEVIVDRMLPRVQGRGERGPPAGGLPRDDHPASAKAEGRFVRQTGGRGQYRRRLTFASSRWSAARASSSSTGVVGGVGAARSTSGRSEEGIREALETGSDRGLSRGGHAAPRSTMARTTRWTRRKWPSRSPARWRFKRGVSQKAAPVMLEPIMSVEVDHAGGVPAATCIGDLNRRRGQIEGMEMRGGAQIVRAHRAAGRDVRLRHRAALDDQRARLVLDGVRPLRRGRSRGDIAERDQGERRRLGRTVQRLSAGANGTGVARRRAQWRSRSLSGTSRM